MPYILITLAVLAAISILLRVSNKKQKKVDDDNANILADNKEKEYFYRGRKTESDWREWFSDILKNNN